MISYGKLWTLLETRGMKKTDLLKVVSSPTLAKLSKNENVNVDMIGKICDFLECQPGDIMENITEKKLQALAEQFDILTRVMASKLEEEGISEEEFISMLNQAIPTYMKQVFSGGNPMQAMIQAALNDMMNNESDNNNTDKD